MSYVIVTDTACNLPKELTDQYDIRTITLTLTVDGKKTELENFGMQDLKKVKELYNKLRGGDTFRTAPASKKRAVALFTEICENHNDILYIGFSSGLSDSFAQVKAAAAEVSALFPERTIKTVDSLGASFGEGILVYRAAMLKQAGKSLDYVAAWAERTKMKVSQYFTVEDMRFLFDSGRAEARMRMSGRFGRKPIIRVNEFGRLVPVKDVKNRKKAMQYLAKRVAKHIVDPDHATVFIAHGDCISQASDLARAVREYACPHECLVHYIDPVLAAAVGPDALGVCFIGDGR